MPFIDGYKPLGNRQGILDEIVLELIASDGEMNRLMQQAVGREEFATSFNIDLIGLEVEIPSDTMVDPQIDKAEGIRRNPINGVNYFEREARNRALGLAGEELMLKFEYHRLWAAGEKRLAEKIEHVAATKGDGLGYDILSYELSGRERLIEVKTTQFAAAAPFYASRNEVVVSEEQSECYQIYRVFSFSKNPKFFALAGSMWNTCNLHPTVYRASPKRTGSI